MITLEDKKTSLYEEHIKLGAKIVPFGGGGTDFRPIFEYISENQEKLPACAVIFTDGEGDYPDESAALGIPVLWIINNDYVTPPFGKIARLNMEKYS